MTWVSVVGILCYMYLSTRRERRCKRETLNSNYQALLHATSLARAETTIGRFESDLWLTTSTKCPTLYLSWFGISNTTTIAFKIRTVCVCLAAAKVKAWVIAPGWNLIVFTLNFAHPTCTGMVWRHFHDAPITRCRWPSLWSAFVLRGSSHSISIKHLLSS